MSNIIQQLKSDGISKGLCQLWQNKLKSNSSVKRMSEMFIRGIDFCISENYPTLEFMQENFKGKCEAYGIFIDDDSVFLINKPDVVLNGNCKAELVYDRYSVSRLFIRHNSKATVRVSGHAYLTIDAFDESLVVVETTGTDAVVLLNIYGNAKAECNGTGIKVIHKNKETY